MVATAVSDPAVQDPKTSSHGVWRVSSGRQGLRGSPVLVHQALREAGVKSLSLHAVRGSGKQWGWLWHGRNILGAASASCHAWGDCETPAVPDGRSSLQQGGDLCLPGDLYVDELQQSDCQEGLESPGQCLAWQQWLEGR